MAFTGVGASNGPPSIDKLNRNDWKGRNCRESTGKQELSGRSFLRTSLMLKLSQEFILLQ